MPREETPILNAQEIQLLRDLAKEAAEAASLPVMAERRALWMRHNRLDVVRPMILVFPEGAWRELLPEDALRCETPEAREMEAELRRRLYYRDHLPDDTVIEKEWVVAKAITDTGWGLEPQHEAQTQETGSWGFRPVIHGPADLAKLRFPEVRHDEAATQRNFETAQDLFGGILDVKLKGRAHVSFHPMAHYTALRGLEQVMLDMCTEPRMLHDAMAFYEEGYRKYTGQLVDQNLLSLNNDGTYHSSGGVGYTDELPAPGFDPDRVRPCDMWASAEAQEMAQVSPGMHEEFVLQYERRLLEPFGLTGYGCCEDLTLKLDYALKIPNIRRISIAPWANVDKCAEKLGGRCIFSWKPHPAHLVGEFSRDMIRDYIRRTLEVSRDCVLEMILKDTHTCEHQPERFTQWTQIARELVEGL